MAKKKVFYLSECKILILIVAFVLLIFPLLHSVLAIDDLMALQGNVKQGGVNLASGNLTVLIYNSQSGGSPIYNSSSDFFNSIVDGKYDIMLGNGSVTLSLEYGQTYFMDLIVNGENLNFNGVDRQIFQAGIGQINGTFVNARQINSSHLVLNIDLSNATNIRASAVNKTTGTSFLGQLLDSIIDTLNSSLASINTTVNIQNLLSGHGLSLGQLNVSGSTFLATSSGNVGIGTTSATQKLDVRGHGNFSGTVFINNATDARSFVTSDVANATYLEISDTNIYMNFTPRSTAPNQRIDFNGGWELGGVSILNGDLYVQTGYFYNISSLQVNTLNINGSLVPYSGFDATFDVGNVTRRWRDLFLSRDANISRDLWVGRNVVIVGNLSGGSPLKIVGDVNVFNNTEATSTFFINASRNSVGVNIANARERLEVIGNIRSGQGPATPTTVNMPGGFNNSDTVLTVISTTNYPSIGTVLIDGESVSYNATNATAFLQLTRGFFGTAVANHTNNTKVNVYLDVVQLNATTPRMVITGGSDYGFGTGNPGGNLANTGLNLSDFLGATFFEINADSGLGIFALDSTNSIFLLTDSNVASVSNRIFALQFADYPKFAFVNENGTIFNDNLIAFRQGTGSIGIHNDASAEDYQLIISGNVSIDDNTFIVDDVNDRIGIGETSPTQKLDVRGHGNFSGTIYINNATDISTFISGNPFDQNLNTTSNVRFANITSTGNLTIGSDAFFLRNVTILGNLSGGSPLQILGDVAVFNRSASSPTLFVNATSKNVGIGTATPSSPLEISSNSTIPIFAGNTNNANNFINLYDGTDDYLFGLLSGELSIQTTRSTNISFFNSGTRRMTITSAGRVGIGTINPTHTLNVNGTSNITGNLSVGGASFNVFAEENDVGIGTTTPGFNIADTGFNFSGTSKYVDIRTSGIGVLSIDSTNSIFLLTDSNVASVSNRIFALQFADYPKFAFSDENGTSFRDNLIAFRAETGSIGIHNDASAEDYQLIISGNVSIDDNTFIVDDVNDRIGIGTTTPSALLDIKKAGGGAFGLNVSGFLYVNDTLVTIGTNLTQSNPGDIPFYVRQDQNGTTRISIDNQANGTASQTALTLRGRSPVGAAINLAIFPSGHGQAATADYAGRAAIDVNANVLSGFSISTVAGNANIDFRVGGRFNNNSIVFINSTGVAIGRNFRDPKGTFVVAGNASFTYNSSGTQEVGTYAPLTVVRTNSSAQFISLIRDTSPGHVWSIGYTNQSVNVNNAFAIGIGRTPDANFTPLFLIGTGGNIAIGTNGTLLDPNQATTRLTVVGDANITKAIVSMIDNIFVTTGTSGTTACNRLDSLPTGANWDTVTFDYTCRDCIQVDGGADDCTGTTEDRWCACEITGS